MSSNIVKDNRIGTFEITVTLVQDNPEELMEIMKNVLVVDVVHDFVHDTIFYTGYSWFFDEVNKGEMAPSYVWTVEKPPAGNIYHIRVNKKG